MEILGLEQRNIKHSDIVGLIWIEGIVVDIKCVENFVENFSVYTVYNCLYLIYTVEKRD